VKIVVFPLSITSSWGNGHATNYRALAHALRDRGHEVVFLERDVPWYASHRDLTEIPGVSIRLYGAVDELPKFRSEVGAADLVMIGSYVPDGVEVSEWVLREASGVTTFFDIDTPVTLEKLGSGDEEYLSAGLVERFDLYLSFTGGPTLDVLESRYGARRALWFPCFVDPERYRPERVDQVWELGYLGTFSADRAASVERLLIEPARRMEKARFVVAGPDHPADAWPPNVEVIPHLAPPRHSGFYGSQRFTLNVTRTQMIRAGYSPSVRLFEAAACGVPVISDGWPGIDEVFKPDEEILLAHDADDVVKYLQEVDDDRRREIAEAARRRVLGEHTAEVRVVQLEEAVQGAGSPRASARPLETLQSTGTAAGDDEIGREIARLGPWFHNLHLPSGHQTAPDHPLGDFPNFKWEQVKTALPDDLTGWTVLDIGCNAGFYTYRLAARGAQVLAVDHDEHYLRQARWARERFHLPGEVSFRQMSVYDLARLEGRFDLVLFMGVLYHLRYPLLALDLVAEKVGRLLLLQTLTMPQDEPSVRPVDDVDIDERARLTEGGWPRAAFVEHRLAGDDTNWWVPNRACVEAMVRSAGLQVVQNPAHEFFLCERRGGGVEGELNAVRKAFEGGGS
jgi:methyltransferase (TIGR04290 family)